MSYRCDACGNKTRFDVFETKRVRGFHHYTLAGEMTVEEEEVLEHTVERVVCRCVAGAGEGERLTRLLADAARHEQAVRAGVHRRARLHSGVALRDREGGSQEKPDRH